MKKSENNYAFIDSQNLNLSIQENVIVPNVKKFSALLKYKQFRPHLRFMNDLQKKLEYKKKGPHKDGTL